MDLTIWHQRSGKKKPDSGTYWCVLYLDLIQFLAGSLPMSQNLRYKVEVAAKLFSKGDNDSPLRCRYRCLAVFGVLFLVVAAKLARFVAVREELPLPLTGR